MCIGYSGGWSSLSPVGWYRFGRGSFFILQIFIYRRVYTAHTVVKFAGNPCDRNRSFCAPRRIRARAGGPTSGVDVTFFIIKQFFFYITRRPANAIASFRPSELIFITGPTRVCVILPTVRAGKHICVFVVCPLRLIYPHGRRESPIITS